MGKSTEQRKIALLRLLDGYRKANKIIMAERKRRLATLTEKESLSEYNALCRMWDTIKKGHLERLEDRKISSLIKRRQIFNRVGKAGKNL